MDGRKIFMTKKNQKKISSDPRLVFAKLILNNQVALFGFTSKKFIFATEMKKNFIAEQLFWIKILEFLVDLFSYIYFVMKNLHQRYKNELSEI